MHQYADRDQYVKIIIPNIQPNLISSITAIDTSESFGLPYDINSLMHYGPTDSANQLRLGWVVLGNMPYTMWPLHKKDRMAL